MPSTYKYICYRYGFEKYCAIHFSLSCNSRTTEQGFNQHLNSHSYPRFIKSYIKLLTPSHQLGWCQRGAVPPPYRRGAGGRRAGGGRVGERGRDGSRRAGAGAIAPLTPALAGARGREAGGSVAARWRRCARVRGVVRE
jgi:hypothetical protein